MSEALEIDFMPPNDFKEFWETKEKELIKYSDMTDKHLINAYNMVSDKLIRFINHCMSVNEEQEPPERVQNAFYAMREELIKRGLLDE